MDIQTRKIEFIKGFLEIQNEELISFFEKVLHNTKSDRISLQEFYKRIDKSLLDSDKNKVTEANQLINEIQKWN